MPSAEWRRSWLYSSIQAATLLTSHEVVVKRVEAGVEFGVHPQPGEKILVTVLRTRFGTPQHALAELFGVVSGTISHAQRQIKPLLEQGKHTIKPGHARLRTLAELTAYAATHGITLTPGAKAAC